MSFLAARRALLRPALRSASSPAPITHVSARRTLITLKDNLVRLPSLFLPPKYISSSPRLTVIFNILVHGDRHFHGRRARRHRILHARGRDGPSRPQTDGPQRDRRARRRGPQPRTALRRRLLRYV
jgi:hypothetical protein